MNTKQQKDLLFLVNDAVELRNSPKEPREITAEMIPQEDDVESRRTRQGLILEFYKWWKSKHPEQKLRNVSLNEDINIRPCIVDLPINVGGAPARRHPDLCHKD